MTSHRVVPVEPLATADRETPSVAIRPAVLGAYLGMFVVAEWLVTVSVPAAAAVFGLLAVTTCLALPLPLDRSGILLLPVLAALPVVRLSVLAMPTADLTPMVRGAVLAVPTLVAVVAVAGVRPRPWRLLRSGPGGWRTQACVALVALPLAAVVYGLGPPMPGRDEGVPVAVACALLALAVIADELLFRGILVPALAGILDKRAVLVAAIVYTSTFVAYGSLSVIVAAFGVGLTLGWLRLRTMSVAGVVAARVIIVLLLGVAL